MSKTSQLSDSRQLTIILRDELYGGSWRDLEGELLDRRNSKPVIPGLFKRIDRDLREIADLRRQERASNVNLSTLIEKEKIHGN
jgi:hypothetical protein